MKKLFVMALVAATAFASCSKGTNANTADATNGKLVVKIADVQTETRVVQAPANAVAATLNNGYIFVFAPTGGFVHGEALNVISAKTATGQELIQPVPSDSRVYVVGNIPGNDPVATFGSDRPTEAAVLAATSLMTTQTDYMIAALANKSGAAETISQRTAANGSTPAVYEAKITLTPLISRLELVSVQGGEDAEEGVITGFDVTGVYVDSYYPSFTYAGGNSGTIWSQNQSTDFTGNIGDAVTYSAADENGVMVAKPAAGNVWAYNVASGGVPRLIVELQNIKYTPKGGTQEPITGTFYLTVTGYTGVTAFERGKIYRIGTDTNKFIFSKDDLGLTPNPINVTLFVAVEVGEWVLETPAADL